MDPRLYYLPPPPFLVENNDTEYGNICSADPFPLHSPGIWGVNQMKGFLDYPLPRLLIQLVLIYIVTQILYIYLRRFRFPRTVPEILAGIILGPTILGRLWPALEAKLFPPQGHIYLSTLAKIGFIFFMFLSGVKMAPSMIKKSGKKAWTIAVMSAFIPVIVALIVSNTLPDFIGWSKNPSVRLLLLTQTLTPFPVVARLLNDLRIMNTEIGHLGLVCALIRDLLRTTFSSFSFIARIQKMGSVEVAAQVFVMMVVVVGGIIITSRPLFRWIIRRTPEGKPVKGIYISLIIFFTFLVSLVFENFGVTFHFGPFLLGLCVPDGPPLGSTLDERLDTIISGLFAPLVITYCGLHCDLFAFVQLRYLQVLWVILIGASVVRFTASFIPAVISKMPRRDAAALALILSPQGIVELGGFLNALETGVFDEQTFATATQSVLIVTMVIPILTGVVYDFSRKYGGYQKRSVQHLPNDAELRVFACAHRPDDAMAVIKLIECSNPTHDRPICVYALHLAELVGRASPLVINHQLGQMGNTSGIGTRAMRIIELFNHFEKQNLGSVVTTQKFTAVSLPKFMHDDICLMAFQKLASLIILPFHKKWNSQGKIVLDNSVWRSINRNVLLMAPCSVGILIDRRKVNRSSSSPRASPNYNVSVIFVGGDDDREALAFAKRVVNAQGIHLTVNRLYCDIDFKRKDQDWDHMLDDEVFRELRISSSSGPGVCNVSFREEKVKDGAEMAAKVHEIEAFSDLIVVGRRHDEELPLLSGLNEWMEVPELGPVGDILASGETDNPVSVLVVQKQMHLRIK